MQKVNDQINELGASLVAVSPQVTEKNRELIEKHKLSFEILSDHGNAYAAKLGIRFEVPSEIKAIYTGFGLDLAASNGEPSWTLPIPARLVVDSSGVVRAADIDPNYTVRPEPEKTLDDLKLLV